MPRPPVVYHNLRGNAAERSPRHVAVLDTETAWRETNDGEMHVLRLWAMRMLHRGHEHPRLGVDVRSWGRSVPELVDTLTGWVRHADSLWLYIHNTNFDLAVTRLPMALARAGWELGDHGLTMDKPWFRMRGPHGVLTVLDSSSVWPESLERVGLALRRRKRPLPGNEDEERHWLARCEQDVDILADAVSATLDWWDEHRLGCWSLTGAATGWNAFRHRRTGLPIAIDPDPQARAFERSTLYGGRRDVWRVGHLARAQYIELDFERVHLTACRFAPLPRRRGHFFDGDWKERDWLDPDRYGAVAECTVRTDTPRYPVRIAGRVWHPTGEFRTVLAWPELLDARARGELVAMHRGYTYWLAPHMADWATWVNNLLDAPPEKVPAIVQLMAKAWSRTVPGKWATRSSREIERRPSHVQEWAVEHGIAHPEDAPITMLHMLGEQVWYLGDQDGDDCFPAVLSFVQSHTRVALNRLLDALPPESVVACNTDGVIVKMAHAPDIGRLAAATWPFRPRVKASYRDVQVLGSNHLLLDGRSRLGGVPAKAERTDGLTWSWNTWPSLRTQVRLVPGGGYLRIPRSVNLSAVPVTRWVVEDGRTVPARATTTPTGGVELVPWHLTPSPLLHEPLRRPQHPTLERALSAAGMGDAMAAALAAAS
jgi:hypothetical protein